MHAVCTYIASTCLVNKDGWMAGGGKESSLLGLILYLYIYWF